MAQRYLRNFFDLKTTNKEANFLAIIMSEVSRKVFLRSRDASFVLIYGLDLEWFHLGLVFDNYSLIAYQLLELLSE